MSTAAVFDASARKRPVNLSLNEDLVAQACQLTDNHLDGSGKPARRFRRAPAQ